MPDISRIPTGIFGKLPGIRIYFPKTKDLMMGLTPRFTKMLGIELPIIQAPMAGSSDVELAIAVSEAGALGSLPCAMLTPDQVTAAMRTIRERSTRPINLDYFCHRLPTVDSDRERRWQERLTGYYS